MKKLLVFIILLSVIGSSCHTYYAGYGKGQATHRKCGQKNANSKW